MTKIKYKVSYGIALCKYNKLKNNQPEILMVKKRYTYQYFMFVYGYYKKSNIKYLMYLFDNMTFGEKVDILSMNFDNIWYRLWLINIDNINNILDKSNEISYNLSYYKCKRDIFNKTFLKDGGALLKKLINNSTNSVTPWEIPKGSAINDENHIDCAIREFEEETGISSDNYNILWNVDPVVLSHKDENIVYKSIYYVAYLKSNSNWTPKISFNNINQINELEQVCWISLNDISFLGLNEKNKSKLIRNYKNIIYWFKKFIKSYYYK